MKESIQQTSSEVSIVIYDSPLPPKYLRFSKKFIRTIFIVVPVCLGAIAITLLMITFGSKVKDAPSLSLPEVMTDEEAKVLSLQSEIKTLNESNVALQNKLSSQEAPSAGGTQDEAFLSAIKRPYGMQNLMSENRISVDQFELIQNKNKTTFKFVIISTVPETKVTGHVLVFMISEMGLMAYPSEANMALDDGIKFSMGEPFSVSRLRPTNAEFVQRAVGESIKFLIYVFTREGDLLLIKETESFKTGDKS